MRVFFPYQARRVGFDCVDQLCRSNSWSCGNQEVPMIGFPVGFQKLASGVFANNGDKLINA
jgi:hypothetical protein